MQCGRRLPAPRDDEGAAAGAVEIVGDRLEPLLIDGGALGQPRERTVRLEPRAAGELRDERGREARHVGAAEAQAVIGKPHKLVGESIKAFVILKQGEVDSPALIQSIKDQVMNELGKIGVPSEIDIVPSLPKTRSGKIMRRLLRSIAKGEEITQDVSTLENPAILQQLKQPITR